MAINPVQISPREPGIATLAGLVLGILSITALSTVSPWIRSWLVSGTAVESLVLILGPATSHAPIPSWLLLVTLNAVFAIVSTSWLLYDLFAVACWILVVLSCLVQYAYVSSFARARLRWLSRHLHFYQDKVALFRVLSVILDIGIGGQIELQGLTFSILDLRFEVHGIAISLVFATEHEISIYCDRLEFALFRRVYIDEIFAVHNILDPGSDAEEPSKIEANYQDLKTPPKPAQSDNAAVIGDNIQQEADDEQVHTAMKPTRSLPEYTADCDAESRYREALDAILIATRVHAARERAKKARNDSDSKSEQGKIEYRTSICAELRSMGSIPSPTSNAIKASKLAAWTEPMTRLLSRVPILLRFILVPMSHFHPIECPSICVAGSGGWPSSMLLKKFNERHDTDDHRISDLIHDISEWLATAEYCVDFTNIKGDGQVPFRTSYNISTGLSSSDVVVTRMDAGVTSIRRMIQLKGADASFTIPACLLPHHGHLIPPKPPLRRIDEQVKLKSDGDDRADHMADDGSDNDTAEVHMSVRATLPARFDESFFSFATTAVKASQMLDIDEEDGLPPEDHPGLLHGDGTPEKDDDKHHSVRHAIKQKLAHGRLGEAIRVPAHSIKRAVHKETKKIAVDSVDGGWFAKWTKKGLDQLEWVNGDLGYSNKIPVKLDTYRT